MYNRRHAHPKSLAEETAHRERVVQDQLVPEHADQEPAVQVREGMVAAARHHPWTVRTPNCLRR